MNFGLIMLASGFGNRFGSNKLLVEHEGKKLYTITLDKLVALSLKREDISSLLVVTQYPEIVEDLEHRGIEYAINDHAVDGISSSLKVGITRTLEINAPDAIVCFVADQPFMKIESYEGMLNLYKKLKNDHSPIITCYDGHQRGNPVIFDSVYFPELLKLTGDEGGKQIINRHMNELFLHLVDEKELKDIDQPVDLK